MDKGVLYRCCTGLIQIDALGVRNNLAILHRVADCAAAAEVNAIQSSSSDRETVYRYIVAVRCAKLNYGRAARYDRQVSAADRLERDVLPIGSPEALIALWIVPYQGAVPPGLTLSALTTLTT